MKNLKIVPTILLCALFLACNNTSPQEKAAKETENLEEKSFDAAEEAFDDAKEVEKKNAESMIYANKAASNEAISKIPLPPLSNEAAKKLCNEIGRSIVDRINAESNREVESTEKKIIEHKANVDKALVDNKITAEDKKSILDYAERCLLAANENSI